MAAMEMSIHRPTLISPRAIVLTLASGVAGFLLLLMADEEQRAVGLPLLVVTCTFLWFLLTLWDRDRKVPFFDLGFICASITFLYIAFPVTSYLIAGLEWTRESDVRLQIMVDSAGGGRRVPLVVDGLLRQLHHHLCCLARTGRPRTGTPGEKRSQ